MRAVALGLTGLLILAALTPLALGSERDDRPAPQERAADHRKDPAREARGPERAAKGNLTSVTFEADGRSRDNGSFDLRGLGDLQCRFRENETRGTAKVDCRGRINATVLDANGTELKSGPVYVVLHAVKNETGAWKWHLISLGHGKRGHVIVALHGDAASQNGDQLSLSDGTGVLIVKKHDEQARQRLRLSDGALVLAKV